MLEHFPKELTLDDGTVVSVRPLTPADGDALLHFFQKIPETERYWLKEDVSDPAVISRWMAELDYQRVLPLVAERGGQILADATLHRRGYGARSLLGEVRVVVATPYRRKGLGLGIVAELVEMAEAAGLRRLFVEIISGIEQPASEVAEQVGFQRVAVIPDHLAEPDGRLHDLIILALPLEE
jgi:L-amino acid N-acyltransferase YncA